MKAISRFFSLVAALVSACGLSLIVAGCATYRLSSSGHPVALVPPDAKAPPASGYSELLGAPIHETTLDNGLRVLIAPRRDLPIVSTYIWYGVGSVHEEAGMSGVAHYLEHMMFKGSRRFGKGATDVLTAKFGGANNAFTSHDYTAYFFNLPASAWTLALDIEADRMTTLELNDKEFEAEKLVVQEEANGAYDDPQERVWDDARRLVLGDDHPYSHPILGFPEDIRRMSVDDMRRFYERYYTPDNAVLAIAGDVDPAEALERVRQRFDHIPAARFSAPRPARREAPPASRQRRIVRLADVGAARVMIVLPGLSLADAGEAEREVLTGILAGSESSRLHRRLVLREQLCESVSAYDYTQRLAGTFHIDLAMRAGLPEADIERAIAAVFEELDRIRREEPGADEVARVVKAHEISMASAAERVATIASLLGSHELIHGGWRSIERNSLRIRDVAPDSVRAAARRWSLDRDPVVALLLPHDRLPLPEPEFHAPEMPVLDVREATFDNGLRLLMLPQEGSGLVAVHFNCYAGIRTEPENKPGLSDLFGATLGTGTESRDRERIAADFEERGIAYSIDERGIRLRALRGDLSPALGYAADIFRHALFPEEQVALERGNLESTIERMKESHTGLGGRALRRAIYGHSNPLGSSGATSVEALRAIGRDDLLNHYRRYVAPNNTRIVCVGPFDPVELRARVEALFGDWKAVSGATERRGGALPENPRRGKQRSGYLDYRDEAVDLSAALLSVDHPEKSQCAVMLGQAGVARSDPDYDVLRVLGVVLGDSPVFSDRFSRILRDERGLAYSVAARFNDGVDEQPGWFSAFIATRPESVPQALSGMKEIIAGIRVELVSEEELDRAKRSLLTGPVFALESDDQLADLIARIDHYGLGWDYLRRSAATINAVSREDLLHAAQKHLDPDRMVTVIAGPLDRIPADGNGGD